MSARKKAKPIGCVVCEADEEAMMSSANPVGDLFCRGLALGLSTAARYDLCSDHRHLTGAHVASLALKAKKS